MPLDATIIKKKLDKDRKQFKMLVHVFIYFGSKIIFIFYIYIFWDENIKLFTTHL